MKGIYSSTEFKRHCQRKVGVDAENQDLGAGGREAGLGGTQEKYPSQQGETTLKRYSSIFKL